MKIKEIKEIKTWTPSHGKYIMYSTWAIMEYQDKEVKGIVTGYLPLASGRWDSSQKPETSSDGSRLLIAL